MILLLVIVTIYFFQSSSVKKLSLSTLPSINLSGEYLLQNSEVTKIDIKPLDIFPSNFEDTIKSNNLALTNHERTSLLRDGFVRLSDTFVPSGNIYVPEQIVKEAHNYEVNLLNKKLLEEELKLSLTGYIDKILIESKKSIYSSSKYSSVNSKLTSSLSSLKVGLDTNLTDTLIHLNITPNELGLLLYLTQVTKSESDYSRIYSLSSYLGYYLNNFDLYKINKYAIDNKIENLDTLISSNLDKNLPNSGNIPDVQISKEQLVSNLDTTCVDSYKNKTLNIELSETLKVSLDKKISNTIDNLTKLDISYKYTEDMKILRDNNLLISNYICQKSTNTNSKLALYLQPNTSELIVGYLENSFVQSIISDDNFNEAYDTEPLTEPNGSVRVPILMYHQIEEAPQGLSSFGRNLYVSPDNFEKHLAYLVKKNYKTISPKDFYELLKTGKNPTQKTIMLTFDDGVKNHYTNAYRLLKKYGFSGVFYVPSNKRGLTNAELKEMADNGMYIDSHAKTHMDLQKEKNYDTLYSEIVSSKAILESITGKEVESLAYPYCVANSTSISLTAKAGYYIAGSCGNSIDHTRNNRLTLSRVHANESLDEFKNLLSGKR
ncbi:MAG: polysaccharide deacetylase family protein [bacterium]